MSFLSTLGLTMLFLLAGYELDFSRIRGRPLRRSSIGWLGLVVLGVLLGLALAPSAAGGVMVGICLTSTALGTIMPVLRDAGQLDTPFGTAVTAIGASGNSGRCWPLPCSSAGAARPRRACCCWCSPR